MCKHTWKHSLWGKNRHFFYSNETESQCLVWTSLTSNIYSLTQLDRSCRQVSLSFLEDVFGKSPPAFESILFYNDSTLHQYWGPDSEEAQTGLEMFYWMFFFPGLHLVNWQCVWAFASHTLCMLTTLTCCWFWALFLCNLPFLSHCLP